MVKVFYLISCLLLISISSTHAQDFPYQWPTPAGWTTEKFGLPPTFARSIPFNGVEDIRFAPGWANSNTKEYWAYDFVWLISGTHSLTETKLSEYLRAYYTGVYLANLKDKPVPLAEFTRADLKKVKTKPNDNESYEGMVHTLDFLTGNEILFHARVHLRSYPDANTTAILFQVSSLPYKYPVWKDLDNTLKGFQFGK